MNKKGFKLAKHKAVYQTEQDLSVENNYVIPVDTSITSLLAQNAPNYAPVYTGDMPDISKMSLMDLKDLQNQTLNNIEYSNKELTRLEDEYKKTQIQNPALLNEDGTTKEVI